MDIRIEDVQIMTPENTLLTIPAKVGVHPDNFNDFDVLFEHPIDEQCYFWFTETEYSQALQNLPYELDQGMFITEMSNNNKPFNL